jgi:hypothetical protein
VLCARIIGQVVAERFEWPVVIIQWDKRNRLLLRRLLDQVIKASALGRITFNQAESGFDALACLSQQKAPQ